MVVDENANSHLRLHEAFWEEIAGRSTELEDNLQGSSHLALRFVGQYLPILLRTKNHEERERVWFSFWSYLVARETDRKPFGLSQGAADEIIVQFKAALVE